MQSLQHPPTAPWRGRFIRKGAREEPVGFRLWRCREEKGYTRAEAARRLAFSEARVAAIEEGTWSALPRGGALFGFVRSYAELLGLDADDILRCLRRELDPSLAPRGSATGHSARRRSARQALRKFLLILLVPVDRVLVLFETTAPSPFPGRRHLILGLLLFVLALSLSRSGGTPPADIPDAPRAEAGSAER